MSACGAKKRSGDPCQTQAMPNGRCRMHGGATPSGIALPQTTHGRYSKAYGGLAARVTAALDDPDLLAMNREIALTDARLGELVEQPLGAEAWAEVRDLIEQRRRLVESERKRLVDLRQMMSATEAVTFVLAVMDVVKRHVADRHALVAIGGELERLIRRPDSPRLPRSDEHG
jgi:hypothetical protein